MSDKRVSEAASAAGVPLSGEELVGGGPCALCGRDPAAGFASINDDWYCHGDNDPEPTCYMRSQSAYSPSRAQASALNGNTTATTDADASSEKGL